MATKEGKKVWHDQEGAHEVLINDYFVENPKYDATMYFEWSRLPTYIITFKFVRAI